MRHQHELCQEQRKWRRRRKRKSSHCSLSAPRADRWLLRFLLLIVFVHIYYYDIGCYATTTGDQSIDSDQITAYNSSDQSNTFLVDYSFLAGANYVEDDDVDTPTGSAADFEVPLAGSQEHKTIWRRQVVNSDDYADWGSSSSSGGNFAPASELTSGGSGGGDSFASPFQRRSPPYSQMDSLSSNGEQQDATLQNHDSNSQQQQQKVGPQFVKEPPSFIHYLNSSDLVIPCAASGQPTPTISWWHKGAQVEMGSLLDKRYVRYDNSLVISAFKEHEFEPEIHSTIYKCQAANPWGSIVSRDVVISAVIDHETQVSVGDQFVTVDNDAIFKCQFPPQTRDFLQVVGWLEDGQNLIQAPGLAAGKRNNINPTTSGGKSTRQQPIQLTSASQQQQPPPPSPSGTPISQPARVFTLNDGQLLIQRVQLRDANKSFRCQYRNLLNSRLGLSPISGRLFVTDASESGAAPRIVESPKPISIAKLNDQLLLSCLAQGSPRPTIRWFKQVAGPTAQQNNGEQPNSSGSPSNRVEWAELSAGHPDVALASDLPASAFASLLQSSSPSTGSGQSTSSSSGGGNNNSKYVISSEANLLLIRSLHQSDNRIKFKCLANNTFGMHFAETELRLEMWPQVKLIESEPKLEFIDNNNLQQQTVTFNCTIRQSPSEPLIGVEWLKNGKLLFAYSLPSYVQSLYYANSRLLNNYVDSSATLNAGNNLTFLADQQTLLASVSLFDDPNAEISAIENLQMTIQLEDQATNEINTSGNQDEQSEIEPNYIITQASISKLTTTEKEQQNLQPQGAQMPVRSHYRGHPTKRLGPRQKLRLATRDQLLYQLQLDQVRRADRGSYQCRARTMQTTLQSTSQLMLKDNPPKFVDTFPSQLLTKSHLPQASLKCVASGSPLPEISWSLSGFQVPESSRFRVGDYVTRDGLIVSFVNITNVQPEDGGLYECSAANDVGQLRHSAWLNVTGPVYIRPMPSVAAIAGRSLSIMCPVGGWPIEQISWFQNSTKLPLNHRQKLTPNGTLSISDLNEVTDSGRYSCQAKSTASDTIAVNHVQVSVKVPPVVEPFAFAKSLHRGQRYNVMCTVVRGDLPVQIRWFKDGRPLDSAQQPALQSVSPSGDHLNDELTQSDRHNSQPVAGSGGIVIKQLDPYSSTLTFASLQANHRGQYSCEATNEAGKANQSSNLVIHVPPEWRIEPKDMSVTVGRTAVIDCQADAFPAARIEWRLSQDLFRDPPSEFKPITSSLYMRVFENGSLIIYNTQRTDAGYYLCQANNGVGPGLSRVIKLTVHVAAHFKSKIRTELVRRSHLAKLKCESIGDLPIDINWLKDKMPLYAADYEPRYAISKTMLTDGCVSELTISETDRSDSALFTCITQNQFGTDDTNIQLIVQSIPDPPLDIRIHEYEARSVKISWLLGHTGNSPISKFIVSYAQTSEPKLTGPGEPQFTGGSNGGIGSNWLSLPYTNLTVAGNESSVLLSGLTPLTEYQFYMVAVNSLGASKLPSEPIKFRTDDEAPSAPPLLVKAQASSSKSIRVRWRAPERRAHFGSISGFYVGYKLHRLDSMQSAGGAAATAAPSGQSGSQLSSGGGSGDTFIYKTVELNQNTNQLMPMAAGQDKGTANQSSSELECQLTGLRRGHKYLITVQAFNSRGAGPSSEPIVAETWRIDVPEAPSLRMVARTTRSIHLAWRLAPSGRIGDSSSSNGKQADTQQAPLVRLRHTQANGMKSRQFSPEALELIELSENSADSASNRIDSMAAKSIGNNNMDAIERQAEEAQANEPILGFILARKQISAHPTEDLDQSSQSMRQQQQQQPVLEIRLPSDHLSQIVDNLTCGTRYSFTISALNSVGPSAPSEPLIVKTEGGTPVAPDKSSLLSLNSSSVIINLAAWHNGACPMRSFDILFKPSRAKKWTPLTNYQLSGDANSQTSKLAASKQEVVAGNSTNLLAQRSTYSAGGGQQTTTPSQQQQQQSPPPPSNQLNNTIVLDDLSASLNYDLKILATNEAGSTEALYTFNTNGGRGYDDAPWGVNGGDFSLADANFSELFAGSSVVLPWMLFLLFISLLMSTVCFLIVRRRHVASSTCSLSLSSASRSNQSSSNYYSTSASDGQQHNNHLQAANQKSAATLEHPNGRYASVAAATLSRQQRNYSNDQQLDEVPSPMTLPMPANGIYGHQQQQQQHPQSAGGHYAYLANQASTFRPASPQNTDLASVMNGSEAEMCLGASALDLAVASGQQRKHAEQHQQQQHRVKTGENQGQSFYMAPLMHSIVGKQQMSQLNKSSTLPANCQQQILQQMLQQPPEDSATNHELIDNLMAANMMQQQQQQQQHDQAAAAAAAAAETYLANLQANATAAAVAAVAAAQANGNTSATGNESQVAAAHMAQLLEHQLHQQVYATVKRGCPRPIGPRLCDYSIYQCPGGNHQQQQRDPSYQANTMNGSQQPVNEQLQCCANLQMQMSQANNGIQTERSDYAIASQMNCNEQTSISPQQHQQILSDYQQLRPI